MTHLGSQSRLYIAYNAGPLAIDAIVNTSGGAVGGSTTVNTIHTAGDLLLVDEIRDVNIGGSNNTVDTTTRESARQGFSTSIIATSDSTMTVQMVYKNLASNGAAVGDTGLAFDYLMEAFVTKSEIFAVDLDSEIDTTATTGPGATTNHARGLAGNWSVGFSQPKEVQGLVVVDWEFALSSKAQWIEFDATTGDVFKAIA